MKKLNIYKDTKIFVFAPANTATGGPELLHQLTYQLRILGFDAFMYYYGRNKHLCPVHNEYKKYNNPYVDYIEEDEKNIMIVPENQTKFLYNYNKIQKVIWWLSVDNFYKAHNNPVFWKRFLKKLLYAVGILKVYKFERSDIVHFVQSEYAKQHLLKKNIKDIYFLGDYLNEYFINRQLNKTEKEDIVIYNPKKGIEFTKKIIKIARDIKFTPIENMTRKEVADLLSRAKVYIDFGNHPGKDRIPREAAILGCCVILGKRGSAANPYDVPIPERYKFAVSQSNIQRIVETIRYCINNYNEVYNDFETYRDIIRQEPQKFIEDLSAIFTKRKL